VARDPLRMLRTVRLLSVEQARHVLATCLTAEAAAADRLRSINQAAERDRVAYRAVIHSHLFSDMFALRIQVQDAERQAAEAELSTAQAASSAARSALVTARTAAEAVQTLIVEHAEATATEDQRREQVALDDMARKRSNTAAR
jgi:flagellar biosynthesis chaperone FliJ